MAIATKTNPELWERCKRDAKARMGGKHSARAMQLATQLYKKRGGGYSGKKPSAKTNSLKKWGKQKWQWSGGEKKKTAEIEQGGRGVYLPADKIKRMKASKEGRKALAAAERKKAKANREGRQYSRHGLAAGTSLKTKSKKKEAMNTLEKQAAKKNLIKNLNLKNLKIKDIKKELSRSIYGNKPDILDNMARKGINHSDKGFIAGVLAGFALTGGKLSGTQALVPLATGSVGQALGLATGTVSGLRKGLKYKSKYLRRKKLINRSAAGAGGVGLAGMLAAATSNRKKKKK
tara:strand:+ start:95 stop:964 length:870 start_codon:yes stop_codon:yes gene_type:complete